MRKRLRVLDPDDGRHGFALPASPRPMRLALVQLYSEEQAPSSAPNAIEVLAGHVQERAPSWSVSLDVLDNRTARGAEDYVAKVLAERADVVGLSVAQGTHGLALAILDRLYVESDCRSGRPQVVLGNALPTYRPRPYLDRYPGLVIVRGFGEDALLRLLERAQARPSLDATPHLEDFIHIPNLTMLRDGEIYSTPIDWPRHYAVPAWVDVKRYFVRVEASRGCHYDVCTFCTRPPRASGQARWMRYPIDKIAATVQRLKEEGVERFTFCDEDFIGDDPEGCLELAARFESFGGAPSFSFSTRADNIVNLDDSDEKNAFRRALFARLKSVGLSVVFAGLESFCDAQLKRYAKASTAARNIRAVEVLQSLGLTVDAGLIMFDPFMTVDDLQENIDNIDRHDLWKVTSQPLSRLNIQEATPMQRWAEKEGLLGSYDENQMTYTYRFGDPQVAQIAEVCEAWRTETDYAYRLLRNAQRMALFDAFPNEVILAAKHLNFRFLKSITEAVRRDPTAIPAVIDRMRAERVDVMHVVLAVMSAPHVHASLRDRISQEIDGFLGVRS